MKGLFAAVATPTRDDGRPDEAVLRGTLADIRAKVRAEKWTRQALILVGPALGDGSDGQRSRLYSADYTHLFRKASVRRPRTSPTPP